MGGKKQMEVYHVLTFPDSPTRSKETNTYVSLFSRCQRMFTLLIMVIQKQINKYKRENFNKDQKKNKSRTYMKTKLNFFPSAS